MFPMIVKKESGRAESSSGGKDYHLVMIQAASGRSLVIHRWAKKDQWGNGWKVEQFAAIAYAQSAYEKKWNEKLGKAYDEHFIKSERTAHDEAGLRRILGAQYWQKLGEHLLFLDPSLDIKGTRTQPDTEYEEDKDGRIRIKQPAPKFAKPDEPPAKSQEEVIEEQIKTNPNWGLF